MSVATTTCGFPNSPVPTKKRSGTRSGTDSKGDARDKAGERVGVSGRSIDKAADIIEHRPDLIPLLEDGNMTFAKAAAAAKERQGTRTDLNIVERVPQSNGTKEISRGILKVNRQLRNEFLNWRTAQRNDSLHHSNRTVPELVPERIAKAMHVIRQVTWLL